MLQLVGESDARKELIDKSGNFSWAELVELEEAQKIDNLTNNRKSC